MTQTMQLIAPERAAAPIWTFEGTFPIGNNKGRQKMALPVRNPSRRRPHTQSQQVHPHNHGVGTFNAKNNIMSHLNQNSRTGMIYHNNIMAASQSCHNSVTCNSDTSFELTQSSTCSRSERLEGVSAEKSHGKRRLEEFCEDYSLPTEDDTMNALTRWDWYGREIGTWSTISYPFATTNQTSFEIFSSSAPAGSPAIESLSGQVGLRTANSATAVQNIPKPEPFDQHTLPHLQPKPKSENPTKRRCQTSDHLIKREETITPIKKHTAQTEADEKNQLLACPFYKYNREKYHGCSRFELRRIKDVRQHIDRKHRSQGEDLSCWRCSRVPTSKSQNRPNQKRESKHLDNSGIEIVSEKQWNELSQTIGQGKSVEEKWFILWAIVFPEHERPSSCFLGSCPEEPIPLLKRVWDKKGSKITSQILESTCSPTLDRNVIESLAKAIFNQLEAEVLETGDNSGSVNPIGTETTSTKQNDIVFLQDDDSIGSNSISESVSLLGEVGSQSWDEMHHPTFMEPIFSSNELVESPQIFYSDYLTSTPDFDFSTMWDTMLEEKTHA